MVRLRLFGRCRIYHDPVSPVLKRPATIGWEGFFRTIDLEVPQPLKGEELLSRMKGWWTVDPEKVKDVVLKYGRIILGDGGELMVELESEEVARMLNEELKKTFRDQVFLAP